jgi:hypothetical protein
LQKSKSAIFDGCNPLKYHGIILDKSIKNQFLQQAHSVYTSKYQIPPDLVVKSQAVDMTKVI